MLAVAVAARAAAGVRPGLARRLAGVTRGTGALCGLLLRRLLLPRGGGALRRGQA